MPSESQDGSSNDYADSDSLIYVYDYLTDAWLKWDNINAQGGWATYGGDLYFGARRLDSDSSAVEFPVAVFNNYGHLYDFNDHHEAVDFSYSTNWESMGEPDLLKKFLRLKIFALSSVSSDEESPLFTLTVDSEHNFNTPAIVSSFDMDFTGETSGWGNGPWGSFPWGDSTPIELKGKLKVVKSRAIRFTFSNSNNFEGVLISGYEIEAAPAYAPFIKE